MLVHGSMTLLIPSSSLALTPFIFESIIILSKSKLWPFGICLICNNMRAYNEERTLYVIWPSHIANWPFETFAWSNGKGSWFYPILLAPSNLKQRVLHALRRIEIDTVWRRFLPTPYPNTKCIKRNSTGFPQKKNALTSKWIYLTPTAVPATNTTAIAQPIIKFMFTRNLL